MFSEGRQNTVDIVSFHCWYRIVSLLISYRFSVDTVSFHC